jgi:hypothetical protein
LMMMGSFRWSERGGGKEGGALWPGRGSGGGGKEERPRRRDVFIEEAGDDDGQDARLVWSSLLSGRLR